MKKLMVILLFVFFVSSVNAAPPTFYILEGDVTCDGGAIFLRNNELDIVIHNTVAPFDYYLDTVKIYQNEYSILLNSKEGYLVNVFADSEPLGNFEYNSNLLQNADFLLGEDHSFCSLCGNGICDITETCAGCVLDCNGQQAECGDGFMCTDGYCVEGIDCISDLDGDGYGKGLGCLGPDCNDRDADINPGVMDICNALDDNCDGRIDEDCQVEGTSPARTRFSPVVGFFDRVFGFLFRYTSS
jgi:hypothetical protein